MFGIWVLLGLERGGGRYERCGGCVLTLFVVRWRKENCGGDCVGCWGVVWEVDDWKIRKMVGVGVICGCVMLENVINVGDNVMIWDWVWEW